MLRRVRRFANIAAMGKAASVATYVGPGDIVSGATVWAGLRGFSAAYATGSNPAVDIVDQAGANSLTVNILSNGNLDVAAVSAWVAAHSVTTIKVPKLYDQTGNSRHFTQATLAKMPVLVLNVLGGNPIIRFNNANSTELDTPSFSQAQPQTMSFVASRTGNFTTRSTLLVDGNLDWYTGWDTTANTYLFNAGNNQAFTASDSAFHAGQFIVNGASSSIYVDGTNAGGTSQGNGISGGLGMGNNAGGFFQAVTGDVGEVGLWPSAFTGGAGNSFNLNSNQHTYWGF